MGWGAGVLWVRPPPRFGGSPLGVLPAARIRALGRTFECTCLLQAAMPEACRDGSWTAAVWPRACGFSPLTRPHALPTQDPRLGRLLLMCQDPAQMRFLGRFCARPWYLCCRIHSSRHVSCLAQGQATLHSCFVSSLRTDVCSLLSRSVQLRMVNVFSPRLRPFSQFVRNRRAVL